MTGIVKIDPRDVERTVKHLLHAKKREDVKVSLAYIVKFEIDDETYVNTIIEPWQPMSRPKYAQLVEMIIKNLDEQEKAQEPKTNAEVDNPFVDSGVVHAGVESPSETSTVAQVVHHTMVAETGIYTAQEGSSGPV